ncbi:MAG: hypothetical protein QM755_03770 [Luteolibacter sp.]
MRAIPLFVMALVLAAASRSFGQVESSELTSLRAGNQKEVQALRELYRTKLAALLKAEVDKGNLEGAAAIRTELAKFDPSVALSPAGPIGPTASLAKNILLAVSSWTNGNTRVQFKPDGSWVENYKGRIAEGRWTREPNSELIQITVNGTSKTTFRVSEDGGSMFGPAGTRYKPFTGDILAVPAPAPSTPDRKSGDDSNPFGNLTQ